MPRRPCGEFEKRLVGADAVGTDDVELQRGDRLLVAQRGVDQELAPGRATGERHLVRTVEVARDAHALHAVVGVVGIEVHRRGEFAELGLFHPYGDFALTVGCHDQGHRRLALGYIVGEDDLFDGQRHAAAVIDAVAEAVCPAQSHVAYLPV